ncbi:LysR family transcriptional regulator, partial [Halobellus sp. Atlit-31R]
RFSRGHSGVQIEVTVCRNADLLDAMQEGALDLALAWHTRGETPYMDILGSYPLHWIGPGDASLLDGDWPAPAEGPLPLVSIEAPCRLRSAATQALDAAGIPWRVVYSSPSLGGVWAAVAAGLGVAVRTSFGLPRSLALLAPGEHALPALPRVELALHRSHQQLAPAAARL